MPIPTAASADLRRNLSMPAHPDAVLEEGRQDSAEAKPQRGSLPTQLRGHLPTRGSLLNMWHRSNADAESTTSVCGTSAP